MGRVGKSAEGLVEAQKLLIEARQTDDEEGIAQAGCCIGWFCLQLGYPDKGLECASNARTYYAGTEDVWSHGLALAVYSWLLLELGLSDLSFESAAQSVVVAERTDDLALNAFALNCKAIALIMCREDELALPMLADALAMAEKSGDRSTIALTLLNTGYSLLSQAVLAQSSGDHGTVLRLEKQGMAINDRAIAIAREAGDLWNLRTALCNGAETYASMGEIARSQLYLAEWEQLPGEVGVREQIHYLYTRGDVLTHLDQDREAILVYEEAFRLATEVAHVDHKVNTLRRLSDVKARLGLHKEALDLFRAFHDAYVSQSGELSRRRAHAMDMQLQNEKLREKAAELEMQAGLDALTGVPNRRAFDAAFASLGRQNAVVGILDVDHFKQVNDRYSHLVGDAVLARVAGVLRSIDRSLQIFRIGGEEFGLIFEGMTREVAEEMANSAIDRIRQTDLGDVARGLRVTASVGLAEHGALVGMTLLAEADRRLYVAKRLGRDMVIADSRPSIAVVAVN